MIFNLGDKYEIPFIITNKTYDGFIHIFHDNNPLHTNSKFAQNKGFKDCVMHGNILNGFLSYFIGEKLPTKDVLIHAQEIQFKNAIYLNESLRFYAEVMEIFESVNAVEFKFNFKNMENKTVAKGKVQIGLI